MTALLWAQVAVALLLFVYAVRCLLARGSARDGKRARSLGCGFGLVAFLMWMLALSNLLDSWWLGTRIAIALVLLLPVFDAIGRPGGAGILRAALSLFLAVLIGLGPVREAAAQLAPSQSDAFVERIETRLDELRDAWAAVAAHRGELARERSTLSARIAQAGHADFDALAADPDALRDLVELRELDALIAATDEREGEIRRRIPELESHVRRLERRVESEAAYGAELSRDELEALLAELDAEPLAGAVRSVDELGVQVELRALFERELDSRSATEPGVER